MIEAKTLPDFAGLARSLSERAAAIATACGQERALEKRKDPTRWRSAKLLWPLFAKD